MPICSTSEQRTHFLREAGKAWLKDPEFRAEYQALEAEFAFASALVEARREAGKTQEQVARAMRITQTVIRTSKATGSKPFDPDPGALRQGAKGS